MKVLLIGGTGSTGVPVLQGHGPRNLVPWEWSVIRRVMDGRNRMILLDNELWIISRAADLVARIASQARDLRGEAQMALKEPAWP